MTYHTEQNKGRIHNNLTGGAVNYGAVRSWGGYQQNYYAKHFPSRRIIPIGKSRGLSAMNGRLPEYVFQGRRCSLLSLATPTKHAGKEHNATLGAMVERSYITKCGLQIVCTPILFFHIYFMSLTRAPQPPLSRCSKGTG
jgi:hypothetical protein